MLNPDPSSSCAFSRTALRRLNRAQRIWHQAAEIRGEVGYLARAFVVVNLPHSDPGSISVWVRTNGDAAITIHPGFTSDKGHPVCLGFPYGSTARWLLVYVMTEAVRKQSPKVCLGESLVVFLRSLGLSIEGRRIRAVREQLARLLGASIRFTFRSHEMLAGRDLSLASDFFLWRQESGQSSLGYATLNDSLFRDLLAHPVPLDIGAIEALRDAPLAIDLFIWLSFRLRSLRHPLSLSWLALQGQFGSDYTETKEFARHVRKELRRVHTVWPSLRTKFYRGGVTFFPPAELPVKMRRR